MISATFNSNQNDEDFAFIYGVMLGDGCLSRGKKNRSISISLNIHSDGPFAEIVKNKLEKIRGKNIRIWARPFYGKLEINFSDKKIFEKFKSDGFPVGKKGIELAIPRVFEDNMKFIISGYFATDGCIIIIPNNGTLYCRAEFSSISLKLLEQIRDYLHVQDVRSKIYVSHKAGGNRLTLYRLQINGIKEVTKFRELVKFSNPKHEEKFKVYKEMAARRFELPIST